jgi:hypothetical protein
MYVKASSPDETHTILMMILRFDKIYLFSNIHSVLYTVQVIYEQIRSIYIGHSQLECEFLTRIGAHESHRLENIFINWHVAHLVQQ